MYTYDEFAALLPTELASACSRVVCTTFCMCIDAPLAVCTVPYLGDYSRSIPCALLVSSFGDVLTLFRWTSAAIRYVVVDARDVADALDAVLLFALDVIVLCLCAFLR